MRKLFTILTAVLALAVPSAVQAQSNSFREPIDAVLGSNVADDTAVTLVIFYIGPEVNGKVVTASGSITLTSGAAGAEAADTTIECPLVTTYGGVLDVSNAACDTVGELVDIVNSTSGSKWRLFPVAALRADVLTTTNLVAATYASANKPNGAALLVDTSVALHTSIVLGNVQAKVSDFFTAGNLPLTNPYKGQWVMFTSLDEVATYTGAGLVEIYDVEIAFNPLTGKYTEVATKVLTRATPGATTAWGNLTPNGGFGLWLKKDHKVLVRVKAATTFTTAQVLVNGYLYRANW
jgi:hypothetical protein